MQTLDFLRLILPETGIYYLVLLHKVRGPAHIACSTVEELAEKVAKFDPVEDVAVYHACSSFREPFVTVDGKKKYRVEENWGQAKALWIDIDCGPDKAEKGTGYATKSEAVRALDAFCKTTAFPPPVVVDSGNGVHCYWPFEEAVDARTWKQVANAFKKTLASHNLLADPTCTADFARILRPVGSHNRKRGEKEVCAKTEAVRYPLEALLVALGESPAELALPETPDGLALEQGAASNDDLTAHSNVSVPASAEAVAIQCNQVRFVRDTQGDGTYEHWRGVIGLITHCVEGKPLAAKWTAKRHETHDSYDWEKRYDTWNAGPTTCQFFETVNPSGCEGCPHKGLIKSPIRLGHIAPEPAEQKLEGLVDGEVMEFMVPPLPSKYTWTDGHMIRYVPDKTGQPIPVPFCKTLFYPMYRVRQENGDYNIGVRMHLPNKHARNFEIDTGLLASPTKLMEELGRRGEIVQTNHKDAPLHMTAYLRESLEQLKREAEEMNTMISFGWKNDMKAFLVGDRLYHADGTERRVLLGGYAIDHASHFPLPRGTLEGYAKGLNHVYNRSGMEPLQYAVCSGFGSVLTPFGENLYHGLLMTITGGESARGKSTVCHAAMYAFGDADRMTIKSQKGATNNALYAQLGTYGSLPMLFDEYTNIEPEELSEFAYRISQGEEKGRLTTGKGGVRKAAQAAWHLSPYVTANMDLHALLASHTANSQAEAVRMIQIKIDEYNIYQFEGAEAGQVDTALTEMRLNWGTAGDAFIRHVVANVDETFERVQTVMDEVNVRIPGPKYRFYRNHVATTMAAAQIAQELGIIQFDLDKLFDFAVNLMVKLCEAVVETNTVTPDDALGQMLAELGPRILTTYEYRDARDARGPEKTVRITQTIAGRYVMGGGLSKEPLGGRLYLVKKELKEWCMKHRVEPSAILGYAKAHNVLLNESERFTLTRGTDYATSNQRCVVLDMNKLASLVHHQPRLVSPTGDHHGSESEGLSQER